MEAGYSKAGAYKAKERGVISDEKCEVLIQILGDRAREVLTFKTYVFVQFRPALL